MFKITLAIFAVVACAAAKPGFVAPLAYTSPIVAAPGVVTATSSQFVARNHNGIVAPIVAPRIVAPAPLAYSAPIIKATAPLAYSAPIIRTAAPLAYNAPVVASAPIIKAAAPLAYSAPVAYSSPLVHSHLASPLTYSVPHFY